MKKLDIAVIVIAFAASLFFASFGKSVEIADLDTVSGIAVDKTDETWQILCEISVPSMDEAYGSKAICVKGKGYTLADAFKNAAESSSRLLNTDCVSIFILSDSVLTEQELKNYFESASVNTRAVVVLCEGQAQSYIQQEDEKQGSLKSNLITDRVKRFCFEQKTPVPKVNAFLKGNAQIRLTENAYPERSE